MLNQLIESKDHKEENVRKNGFLLTTLGILAAVLVSGWTYSLFAKNFGMGTGDFELSSIVAPVAAVEDAPPKPEPKTETTQTRASNQIILKDLYADISSTKEPPKDLKGVKDVVSAEKYNLDKVKLGDFNQIPSEIGRTTGSQEQQGCGLCQPEGDNKADKETEDKAPEVVVKPTPKPTVKNLPPQSLGVINGRAAYLAMPPYPPSAKLVKAQGAVNVQVLIDETGKVISASAVSGHPLLRQVAENAARQSRFTPTLLSNQPVKVTGVIIYKFIP